MMILLLKPPFFGCNLIFGLYVVAWHVSSLSGWIGRNNAPATRLRCWLEDKAVSLRGVTICTLLLALGVQGSNAGLVELCLRFFNFGTATLGSLFATNWSDIDWGLTRKNPSSDFGFTLLEGSLVTPMSSMISFLAMGGAGTESYSMRFSVGIGDEGCWQRFIPGYCWLCWWCWRWLPGCCGGTLQYCIEICVMKWFGVNHMGWQNTHQPTHQKIHTFIHVMDIPTTIGCNLFQMRYKRVVGFEILNYHNRYR